MIHNLKQLLQDKDQVHERKTRQTVDDKQKAEEKLLI